MTRNEEQQRLIECYGIKNTIYQQGTGGILAVRLAVQKAMDCKIGGRFGYSPFEKREINRIRISEMSGCTTRASGWVFNTDKQGLEMCSLNPAKPRPTMFRVNRFAFFERPKSGTVGSQPVAALLTPYKTDTLT